MHFILTRVHLRLMKIQTKASVLNMLVYGIYPCIMRTFFPLKKLRKLRCLLYTGSFVLDSHFSLSCEQVHEMCPYTIICFYLKEEITISIHFKLPILFRWTTDEQGIKMATKFQEKRTRNEGSLLWIVIWEFYNDGESSVPLSFIS